MGGDHKCPVCEATFTRPQHVARHMRSHTGDRPYKCQYCGDQFARSDLLSRHVNKCHANEKPLPSTGPRKKGSVSASRATTSKQVCDQCVQANSSCDGSNPCAKCIQRRYRCTFVKFHRQTAPVGPGHTIRTGAESSFSNPPSPSSIPAPSPSSRVSSSRVPVFHQQSEDDFILAPPPPVVPTMADALYGATPYTFPPLYPTNDLTGDNTDYVGKYRAHAELFGSTRSSVPAASSSMVSPNLYDPRPPSSWLAWGQQDPSDPYQQQQQRHADLISNSAHPPPSISPISSMNDMQAELARRHHHHQQQPPSNTDPNHYMNVSFSVPQSTAASNYHLVSDPNGTNNNGNAMAAESIYGSDSTSSSAASSFVHLPLAVDNISARSLLGYDNNGTTHDENTLSSNQHHQHQPHLHPHHHHHVPQQQQQQQQQVTIPELAPPEFSSAFGLLSLDDPNVIAGIATDGTPFFDDPNQAHNQARNGIRAPGGAVENGSTPSREKDSKELKEFWKQYMRLPLSGSDIMSSMSSTSTLNASGTGDGQGATPSTSTAGTTSYLRRTTSREMPAGAAGAGAGMGMDNSEDLRSYEAAVMARKAPTTLNLKMRRPMRGAGGMCGGGGGGGREDGDEGTDSGCRDRDEGSASAAMSTNMERPSFKRLPSQTLGPDNSKRPFYGFGAADVEDRVGSGWGTVNNDDYDDDDRKDVLVEGGGGGGGGGGGSSAERKMRRRRMSEPSSSLIGGHGSGFASDREERKTIRIGVSAVQNAG